MKRFIMLSLLAVFAFMGCATIQTPSQPCTIYEDVGATPENSLIVKMISDPCKAQDILATAAKLPMVWDSGYAVKFETWAGTVQGIIEAGTTYDGFQDFIKMQVAKFNKQAGMVLLILSPNIFVFQGYGEIISEIDRTLILMSLEDLRKQVKQLALIANM